MSQPVPDDRRGPIEAFLADRLGAERAARALEIFRFCLRRLSEDRATDIAASLAFRTLFGLLPVLVVVTLVIKSALGDRFAETVSAVLVNFGLGEVTIIPPDIDGAANGATDAAPVTLDVWIGDLVAYAAGFNVTALGWTGFGLVAFSAIWVLATIEGAFNVIFRTGRGRSWMRRILVYWFVLTVAPLLLAVMPYLLHRLGSFAEALQGPLEKWGFILVAIKAVLSIAVTWAMVFLGYKTIPATRVGWKPAAIGALVAAILLEIGKRSFGLYLRKSFAVSALYGSLGLIPLFLFWVYLIWLVILFGAEISSLLQAIGSRRWDRGRVHALDPEETLAAMVAIGQAFEKGKALTTDEVAAASGLDGGDAAVLIDRLEGAGFVRRDDETGISLARPAERIEVIGLLELAWKAADRFGPPDSVSRKLRASSRTAIGGMTLADAMAGR
jgi:membrane protein